MCIDFSSFFELFLVVLFVFSITYVKIINLILKIIHEHILIY